MAYHHLWYISIQWVYINSDNEPEKSGHF